MKANSINTMGRPLRISQARCLDLLTILSTLLPTTPPAAISSLAAGMATLVHALPMPDSTNMTVQHLQTSLLLYKRQVSPLITSPSFPFPGMPPTATGSLAAGMALTAEQCLANTTAQPSPTFLLPLPVLVALEFLR